MSEQVQHGDRFYELMECAQGTLMGRLLRSCWQPVAVTSLVQPGQARQIRVFAQNFALYRGASGKAYLVDNTCAHRLTRLDTGWVQGEEIRCIYHGWKYDGTGQCTETPAETSDFARRIRIGGYPVVEYGGLVFAYLGEGEAPAFDLPRKGVLEDRDAVICPRLETWPCNWFQLVENSLDAVHVSFVHHAGKLGPFGAAVSDAIPRLEYLETEAGLRQIATRGEGNVRISDWTFPNYNHIVIPSPVGKSWMDVCVWRVPIEIDRTLRIGLYAINSCNPDEHAAFRNYMENTGRYDPAEHHDELFDGRLYPEDRLIQLTSAQDYVAALGQGPMPDRNHERLGKSDAGIVTLRRLFWRELEHLRHGRPTKQWRRIENLDALPIQSAS